MKDRNPSRMIRNSEQIKKATDVCNWLVINENINETAKEVIKLIDLIQKMKVTKGKIELKDFEFLYNRNLYHSKNREFLEQYYKKKEFSIDRDEKGR